MRLFVRKHTQRRTRFIAVVLSLTALSVTTTFISCAGTAHSRSDTLTAHAKDEVREAIALAISLSRSGHIQQAMDSVAEALDMARDRAALAAAMEAKAWTLLFAGSREAALEALAQAQSLGTSRSPGATVLEFRLATGSGIAEARRRYDELVAQATLSGRAAIAIAVMLGEEDFRDVPIRSHEDASEYATYLAGYSLSPEPAHSSSALAPASSPVIVVSRMESVEADDVTLAVARISCRDALAGRGRFRIVDSESRRSAMEELELSLSGTTQAKDTDKAVGDLFSADFVASGCIIKVDSGWLVSFCLSNTGDGSIVASDFSMVQDHAGIMATAQRFAASLDNLAPRNL
ncbi:hypothetical protein MASR2M48_10430 [Spirochaetota bacterium]